MGYKSLIRDDGKPWGSPTDLALLEQTKVARQGFQTLYDQPGASYEALRQLARQLPLKDAGGTDLFGVGTALEQYGQLLSRFPAHGATAAADVLQASQEYWAWSRALEEGFDTSKFHYKLVCLLIAAATVNPTAGQAAAARMAPTARQIFYHYNKKNGSDTLVTAPLLRFSYHATQHYLRTGKAVASGLSEAQLRTNTVALAQQMAALTTNNYRPLEARQWLLRVAEADPAAWPAVAAGFGQLLSLYPAVAPAVQPAEWKLLGPHIGLTEPARIQQALAWRTDTLLIPDHPRWQTLTPEQRADLQQALALETWLQTTSLTPPWPQQQLRPATWAYVLNPGDDAAVNRAKKVWQANAEGGSVLGARNRYWAELRYPGKPPLTNKTGLLGPLHRLAQRNEAYNKGRGRYLAALLLLDELPGYPALGHSDKKEGKRWLQEAAVAGSAAAADRLKR